MKQISGKEFARVIRRKGWSVARLHGSHHIFLMPRRRERIVIPVQGNRPLKIALLRALMRIADLTEVDLWGPRTTQSSEWRRGSCFDIRALLQPPPSLACALVAD